MPQRWITDRRQMAEFLARAKVGHLGTSRDGQPYVVPVAFVYRDGCIYIHSGRGGRKIEHIQENPRVCFAVAELEDVYLGATACAHSLRYTSVIAHGQARLIADPGQKRRALQWLVGKYAPGSAPERFSEQALAGVEVIEIVVEEMTEKRNVASGA